MSFNQEHAEIVAKAFDSSISQMDDGANGVRWWQERKGREVFKNALAGSTTTQKHRTNIRELIDGAKKLGILDTLRESEREAISKMLSRFESVPQTHLPVKPVAQRKKVCSFVRGGF